MPDFNTDFISLSDLLLYRAKTSPHDTFIFSETDRITYEAGNCMVETMARNLDRHGVKPSLLVALLFHRTPRLILSYLALIRTGAYPVPVNFHLSSDRFVELLEYLKPHYLIGESSFHSLLESHAGILPSRNAWFMTDPTSAPCIPFTELERAAVPVYWPSAAPEDICYIDTTSGTSGSPKGVMTTHRGIAANARISTSALQIRSSDIHYGLFAPFAHVHEVLSRVLLTGGGMILHDSLHPRSISRMIRHSGATVIMAVPALYSLVLKNALRAVPEGTVRLLESGGGITNESLINDYKRMLGVGLTPVWGSTETAGIAIAGTVETDRSPGCLGRVCTGYEMRLINENGIQAESNEEGELLLRSEAMMKGYYKLPDETNRVLQGGWFHTGDIFQIDKYGFLRFCGRKSEMIKYHGHKIHPVEIEQVLEIHPDIRRAAVIGVWTPNAEEIPVAVLTTRENVRPKESELRSFCRTYLAGYKIPRSFTFRDSLPETSSGKLIKSTLKEEFEKDGI